MGLQLVLIFILGLELSCQTLGATIPFEIGDYQEAQLQDCFGDGVSNLIYRYEGFVPQNPNLRPGCEVNFGFKGLNDHCLGLKHRRTLKYFVTDSKGHENSITRKGYVSLTTTVGNKNVDRNITWDQLTFPKHCYVEPATWLGPYRFPFIKGWPSMAYDPAALGSYQGFSTDIYCHPKGKTRIPVYTASYPAGPATALRSYDQETFIKGPRMTYSYWLLYQLENGHTEWIGCDLRIPLATPSLVFRTFYIGMWAGERKVITENEALQFEQGNLKVQNARGMYLTSMCFPGQCFPFKFHNCETVFNYTRQDFSVYYGKTSIEDIVYDGHQAAAECQKRTVISKIGGSYKNETRFFCSN